MEANSEAQDKETAKSDVNEDWAWLIGKKLIEDRSTVNTNDMIEVMYSLSSNTNLPKDTLQAAVKVVTNVLVAVLQAERKEWDDYLTEQAEEGEILPQNTSANNLNQSVGEMKSLIQDSLLRATTALEEATKELRDARKEVNTPPPQTLPDSQHPSQQARPYAEAAATSLTPQTTNAPVLNHSFAMARAKAKAQQLIFDLSKDHRLLKLSNIAIRDKL